MIQAVTSTTCISPHWVHISCQDSLCQDSSFSVTFPCFTLNALKSKCTLAVKTVPLHQRTQRRGSQPLKHQHQVQEILHMSPWNAKKTHVLYIRYTCDTSIGYNITMFQVCKHLLPTLWADEHTSAIHCMFIKSLSVHLKQSYHWEHWKCSIQEGSVEKPEHCDDILVMTIM